jgi:mRNA-degrading endonuclease YafQ of YafQ-DinJ toxin-antitoxin module
VIEYDESPPVRGDGAFGVLIDVFKKATNIKSLVKMWSIVTMLASSIKFVSMTKDHAIVVDTKSLLNSVLSTDCFTVFLDRDVGE